MFTVILNTRRYDMKTGRLTTATQEFFYYDDFNDAKSFVEDFRKNYSGDMMVAGRKIQESSVTDVLSI